MFDPQLREICAITTDSRTFYRGQRLLDRIGFASAMIEPKQSPRSLTRDILSRIRKGFSVVISPDGTRGPPRIADPFPTARARSAQISISCVTHSVRRALRLPTWDRALIPLPLYNGALLARRWHKEVARGITEEQIEQLRGKTGRAINDLTDEAYRRMGCGVDNSWREDPF